MTTFLNGLNILLNLTDPVANIEPSVSSALAIVKVVTSVSIRGLLIYDYLRYLRRRGSSIPHVPSTDFEQVGLAICGAVQEMKGHVESLLKHLPRIDYCDAIHTGRSVPPAVEKVRVYERDIVSLT
jgi:hypothetical protein